MTIIRTARPDELPAGDYLAMLLAKECTHPDWCLVAEEGDALVGSVVLWAMPGNPVPNSVVLLESPWDDPDLSVGLALLDEASARAKALGASHLGHVVDSPAQAPQFQHQPERRMDLLRRAGFDVTRDGRRFQWLAAKGIPAQDTRLEFRSLTELGPAPFVDLLEALLADTADSLLNADVQRLGLREAATALFEETKEFEYEPHWWEIGFDPDGTPAAISLPSRNPSHPVIAFVGVHPAHRGKGYSTSVVARGTKILAENGATEIRGDCDATNIAMYKGFERAGYENFANRMEFGRAL